MEFSNFVRNNLFNEISQLITRCGNKAIYDEKGNPKEPTLVRDLAKEIAFGLHSALSATFPKYDFQVHAIFCHQFPYVKFCDDPKKSCELGDLLFIFDEEDNKEKGNALLLQAKKIKDIKFKPAGNEETQLKLYTDSPEFTYNFCPSNEKRKIPNNKDFSGAQYMMLFPPYDNAVQFRCVKAEKSIVNTPLVNIDFLGDCLTGLFSYDYGAAYDKGQNFSDDWSKIIHDFLDNLEGKNKHIFDQLKKRDCPTKSAFFPKMDFFDPSKGEYPSIETYTTNHGFAMIYEYQKFTQQENKDDASEVNGKPFLMVHIIASKRG